MQKVLILAMFLGLFAFGARGQDKKSPSTLSRLAGEWRFDSLAGNEPVFKGRKYSDLLIAVDDSTVKVEPIPANGVVTSELVLFTDGRGERNGKVADKSDGVYSRTKWKKGVLIRIIPDGVRMDSENFPVTEKYVLSTDGNTLTIIRENTSPLSRFTGYVGPDSIDRTTRTYKRK